MTTVLFVDDDPLQAHVRRSVLGRHFSHVERAADAAEAFILVEIGGVADVVGNSLVVAPCFGDAINLDGENDGDSFGFELSGERNDRAGAPTVAIQNDLGGALLFFRQGGGGFCAEQAENQLVGVAHAAIFESLHVYCIWIRGAQAFCDLHGRVHGVVVTHVAAEKTDDDGTRIAVRTHGFWFAAGRTRRSAGRIFRIRRLIRTR